MSKYINSVKIACIITTFDRVSDAKGQMDLIRDSWQRKFKEKIDIYHEFNGDSSWYKGKYREDFLFRHIKKPHFNGAVYLIEQGVKHVLESKEQYDFIVIASADVWIFNQDKIYNIINTCFNNNYQIATSIWFGMGLATEFFIITPQLAKKVFPLNYKQFLKKHRVINFLHKCSHSKRFPQFKIATVELCFAIKVLSVLGDFKRVYLIPGRRFVSLLNRFGSKGFYSSHHDSKQRKTFLSY